MTDIKRNNFVTDPTLLAQASAKITTLKTTLLPVESKSFSQVIEGDGGSIGNRQADITYFKDKATGAIKDDMFLITHKLEPSEARGGQDWFIKEAGKWTRYSDRTLDGKDNIEGIATDGFEIVGNPGTQSVKRVKNIELPLGASNEFVMGNIEFDSAGMVLNGKVYDAATERSKRNVREGFSLDTPWVATNPPVVNAANIVRNTILTDPDTLAAAAIELEALKKSVRPYRSFSYSSIITTKDPVTGVAKQTADQQRDINYYKDASGQIRHDVFSTSFKAEALRGSGSEEWYVRDSQGQWKIIKDGALDGKTVVGSVVTGGFKVNGDFVKGVTSLENMELTVLGSATHDYTMATLQYSPEGLAQRGVQFNGDTGAVVSESKKDYGADKKR